MMLGKLYRCVVIASYSLLTKSYSTHYATAPDKAHTQRAEGISPCLNVARRTDTYTPGP